MFAVFFLPILAYYVDFLSINYKQENALNFKFNKKYDFRYQKAMRDGAHWIDLYKVSDKDISDVQEHTKSKQIEDARLKLTVFSIIKNFVFHNGDVYHTSRKNAHFVPYSDTEKIICEERTDPRGIGGYCLRAML